MAVICGARDSGTRARGGGQRQQISGCLEVLMSGFKRRRRELNGSGRSWWPIQDPPEDDAVQQVAAIERVVSGSLFPMLCGGVVGAFVVLAERPV